MVTAKNLDDVQDVQLEEAEVQSGAGTTSAVHERCFLSLCFHVGHVVAANVQDPNAQKRPKQHTKIKRRRRSSAIRQWLGPGRNQFSPKPVDHKVLEQWR